jgi:hypothetical protein
MYIMFILRFSLGGKNNRWTRRSELCKDGHGLFFPRSAIVIPFFKGTVRRELRGVESGINRQVFL